MLIKKRKAQNSDKPFIYNTKKEALFQYVDAIWGWDEQFQKNHFEENLDMENIQILFHDKTDIGILETVHNNDFIDLVNIEIIPEYRNLGIGSNEIKSLISMAGRERKSLHLRVFKDNHKAIDLYKKLGFSECGISDFHINLKLDPQSL